MRTLPGLLLATLSLALARPAAAQRDGWDDALRVPRAGVTLLPLAGWTFDQYPVLPASAVEPLETPAAGEVRGGATILAGRKDRMRLVVSRIPPADDPTSEAVRRLQPIGEAQQVPASRPLFAPAGAKASGAATAIDKEKGRLCYTGVASRTNAPWILVEASAPLRDRKQAEELRRQLAALDLTPFDVPARHVDFQDGWTLDVPLEWRIDRAPNGDVVLDAPGEGYVRKPTVKVVSAPDLAWFEPRARRVTTEYDRLARAAIPDLGDKDWLPATKERLSLRDGTEAGFLIINYRSPFAGSPRYDVLFADRFELSVGAASAREDLLDPVVSVLRTFRPRRDPGGYRDG